MHPKLIEITERIRKRSVNSRAAYVAGCQKMASTSPTRSSLGCSNLAHAYASCTSSDKQALRLTDSGNIAIVSAYNDMLSAHQPYASYPSLIRDAIREVGSTTQFAGGVPAMCDGVTQGHAGMELSLFSRDIIAAATAIALSHNVFDGALLLGICDKIVPGLLIGALSFGHLPAIFIPAGPMPSGLPNSEKAEIRQRYAEGKADQATLLDAEMQAYHSPGTCTFYGTANSNQLLMEFMGLHLPGASFINPGTPLRDALTRHAAQRVTKLTALTDSYKPLYEIVDEKAIVNAMIGLLSSGGSTNHAIHWIAIARAAGIIINWEDFADLSEITPSLTRIYPNGSADINQFHAAGGTAFLIRELLHAGLLHPDVGTVMSNDLSAYCQVPELDNKSLKWRDVASSSSDTRILRSASQPFDPEGGLRVMNGNLGRSIIKVSAVAKSHQKVEAPAQVFDDQQEFVAAFERGELNRDCVAVVRFQGPKANGMPELHKLTPYLGLLQDKGFNVALVTDGRMSGASGKVPAAIHLTPEADEGGMIAKIRDGDSIQLDAEKGRLELCVDQAVLDSRELTRPDLSSNQHGYGRELFSFMRNAVCGAEAGATVFQSRG